VSADGAQKIAELLAAMTEAERLLAGGASDDAGQLLVRTLERFGQACERHDTRGSRCPDCAADEDAERELGVEDNGDGS
jgi:hypothetical protein